MGHQDLVFVELPGDSQKKILGNKNPQKITSEPPTWGIIIIYIYCIYYSNLLGAMVLFTSSFLTRLSSSYMLNYVDMLMGNISEEAQCDSLFHVSCF